MQIENLEFPQLEMLELGSNKIREIENLEGVASIKSLYLGKNRIAEIKNLACLVNLEQIALGVCIYLHSLTSLLKSIRVFSLFRVPSRSFICSRTE